MTTMNISLPDDLKAWVDEQVTTGGYGTTSEFVRHLIRQARKDAARARLEALLLEGLESGEPVEMTEDWWAERRRELQRRVADRGGG